MLSVLISSSCLKPKKRQSIRAKADRATGCVSLPALTTSRAGMHIVCAWSAWKVGSRGRETICLSSSEEVDVVSVDEDSPPQSPQYEELLEVVTRAVAKLNIDWPAKKQTEPQKSKLDERFLRARTTTSMPEPSVFPRSPHRGVSRAERLATSSEVSRAARSAVPCPCAASGHRFSRSNYTRDQSRETDSLSRVFSSVETTAKCVSVGPAHGRKMLSYSVRLSTAVFQRGHSYSGRPRAGSGNGTRSEHSIEEGGHRGVSSSRERVRFLQLVLHSSKEGWMVASHFRSASDEPLSHATEVQDVHYQTSRVSDQVRGLVCHDRSKSCILPCLHPSHSQEVPEVCFRVRSIPISGSSLQPCTLTPHFHEVCGCCSGSAATPVHPHTELHQRLVDFSSIGAVGGSTSRCRSRPHERFGVKTKHQEKCAFSITENHLSGCGVGFDRDAGTSVPCSDRVDPHGSQESERRQVRSRDPSTAIHV